MLRRLLWIAFALVLVVVAAGAYVAWRLRPEPKAPLEDDWSARVAAIAGDGVAAWRDGNGAQARFSEPFGIALGPDGTIYVADAGDAQRIRRLGVDGAVATIAGGERGFADGAGEAARFDTPSGLATGADGTLYVADTANNAIRRITTDGVVSTLAGGGAAAYRDGVGREARFNGPIGVAVADDGRVIVADTYNDRIRAIDARGVVTTIAGSGRPGWADGPRTQAEFDTPSGVAVDGGGTIYVADTGNGTVRVISPGGDVSTLAPPTGLANPSAVAVANGLVYVADEARIVEVRPGVSSRTVAGRERGFADGAGRDARFRTPGGLAVVEPGRLVVADTGNALIRLVAAASQLEVRPPPSPLIAPSFDAEAFALLPLLWPYEWMEGPYEITGTMGESRGGGGGQRFHAGLDVAGDEGMSVFAIRDGVVSRPLALTAFDTATESIAVGPIAYVHLRVGRHSSTDAVDPARFAGTYDDAGKLVRLRVKRGARFRTGDEIGTLNAFNHAHLNIGWPGEEHNPLRFRLPQFDDTIPPSIVSVSLFDEHGVPLTRRERRRLLVSGRVRIVVDAWDHADGNLARRRLGLYALGYQVLAVDGTPAAGFASPRETIVFARLGPDDHAANLVFAEGSGIPVYGSRSTRFLYTVTNALRGGIASEGYWDAGELPPGDYTVRIIARDIKGNEAVRNRDVPVTVVAPAAGAASTPADTAPATN